MSVFLRGLVKRGTSRPIKDELAALKLIRARFEPRPILVPPLPAGAKLKQVDEKGIKGEWIEWDSNPRSTIYYLHGGGYVACSPRTHRGFTVNLSRAAGARVFALDYRLAPEHPFPAALNDALNGYRYLLDCGISPGKIVIGGDSAGGGLTVATLLAIRDAGLPLPSAAFCLSPWTDLSCTGASLKTNEKADPMLSSRSIDKLAGAYYGSASPTNPLVSPIYGDLSGLPPLLIYVSNTEILLDDSVRLADRAKQFGVKTDLRVGDRLPHVWPVFVSFKIPESRKALREIVEFIRQHTS